jgi:serine/threonine protein kinase
VLVLVVVMMMNMMMTTMKMIIRAAAILHIHAHHGVTTLFCSRTYGRSDAYCTNSPPVHTRLFYISGIIVNHAHITLTAALVIAQPQFTLQTGRPPYISANFKTLLDEIMHAPSPQLPKYVKRHHHASLVTHPAPHPHLCNALPMFSPAFNDLLQRCLVKDPSARISLSDVLQHPFWHVKFPPLSLPDQPAAASSGRTVDVMRLSRAMVCARWGTSGFV